MAAPTRKGVCLTKCLLRNISRKVFHGNSTHSGANQRVCCYVLRQDARSYSSPPADQHQGPDIVADGLGNVFHLPRNSRELDRGVGVTSGEQTWKTLCTPDQPPNSKLLRLSIIGRPNCGKSTLTNQLMGWRVSSVSNKVHTTRKRTLGVWTHEETQIVFLDTPGIIEPQKRHKHNLEKSLLTDPHESLETADIVAVVVDVSQLWNRSELDQQILKALHMHPTIPSILVLNKVDILKDKNVLLTTVNRLTEGIVAGKQIVKPKKSKKLKLKEPATSTQMTSSENLLSDNNMKKRTGEHETTPENHNINRLESSEHSDCESISIGQRTTVISQSDSKFQNGCDFNLHSQSDVLRENLEEAEDYAEHEDSKSEEPVHDIDQSNESWVDLHQKLKEVRRTIKNKAGWCNFDRVFMLSALTGDGVKECKEYLLGCAKPGDWLYHSSLVTDQDPMDIAKACVWEQLLDNLRDEIPYNLDLDVVFWEVDQDGRLKVAVDIYCSKQRYIRAALGRGGETIRLVSTQAEEEMRKTFNRDVFLKVRLKMRMQK